MANRYEDRYERRHERWDDDDDRNRGRYGYEDRDRGFFDRAGDEIASWFGDDEAARRRAMDERRERWEDEREDRNEYRTGEYGRRGYGRRDYGDYEERETRGRYTPDYDNDERHVNRRTRSRYDLDQDEEYTGYTADKSNWVSGRGRDDREQRRLGRDYDREYGRRSRPNYDRDYGRTGTGSYDRGDYDRQSSYYGAGRESDNERRGGYGTSRDTEYRERGYGQYTGRENRWGNESEYDRGYGSPRYETGGRGRSERPTDLDRDDRQRGYGRQSGYSQGRDDEYRGYGEATGYGATGARDRDYDSQARASQTGYDPQGYGISRIRRTVVAYIPGPQTGKSPKGYQRSDERLREDVCDRLSDHGEIDASDIDVKVSQGEVTLEGTVDSWQTKRRAEDLAEEVSGVKDVMNRLRVRRDDETDNTTSSTQTKQAKSGMTSSTTTTGTKQSETSKKSTDTQSKTNTNK